jgi:ABC-type multidrug transport system fused ATPase/permease subunit
LIGGLLIYLMLFFIELIDLIRILILIIMKGSNAMIICYWLLNLIFPPLNGKRLILILLKNSSKDLCKLIENDKQILSKLVFTKEIKEKDFNKHLIICFIHFVLLFVSLYLIDLNLFNIDQPIDHQFDQEDVDEDVLQERIDLLSKQNYEDYSFVCKDIIKKYPQKENLAINHLTFSVQQGQCFGLLGFNGAGQSFFLSFFFLFSAIE